jgi:hypothetical protein
MRNDDELIVAVRSNPDLIWFLDYVDVQLFKVAIESDPTSVFDQIGTLHPNFITDEYPWLVKRVIELISGSSLNSVSESYYKICLKAASKDWRVLRIIPDADEAIQLAAVKNNAMAIDFIDVLTPSLQLLALSDTDGMDRVLFRSGDLVESVIKEAKVVLLEKIKCYWDPEYLHPYVEKYLSLANDQEVHEFFGDKALSVSVCIREFEVEPSFTVKQHLIARDGIESYFEDTPADWSFSIDLEIWTARLFNLDDPSLRPEIMYLPSPTKRARLAFVCSLLGVQELAGEVHESEIVDAIEKLKYPEQACWLCWAFGEEVTDTVGRALVAKLCGSSNAEMWSLSATNRNLALDFLADHYSDQDIRAALLIIGKVFPEIALFQASVENFYEDLVECCKELKRVLPENQVGLPTGPHESVAIPELEGLFEGLY